MYIYLCKYLLIVLIPSIPASCSAFYLVKEMTEKEKSVSTFITISLAIPINPHIKTLCLRLSVNKLIACCVFGVFVPDVDAYLYYWYCNMG